MENLRQYRTYGSGDAGIGATEQYKEQLCSEIKLLKLNVADADYERHAPNLSADIRSGVHQRRIHRSMFRPWPIQNRLCSQKLYRQGGGSPAQRAGKPHMTLNVVNAAFTSLSINPMCVCPPHLRCDANHDCRQQAISIMNDVISCLAESGKTL